MFHFTNFCFIHPSTHIFSLNVFFFFWTDCPRVTILGGGMQSGQRYTKRLREGWQMELCLTEQRSYETSVIPRQICVESNKQGDWHPLGITEYHGREMGKLAELGFCRNHLVSILEVKLALAPMSMLRCFKSISSCLNLKWCFERKANGVKSVPQKSCPFVTLSHSPYQIVVN